MYNLKNLNQEEAKNLVRKLGESYKSEEIERIIENEPQRLEALRRLTGGDLPECMAGLERFVADRERPLSARFDAFEKNLCHALTL